MWQFLKLGREIILKIAKKMAKHISGNAIICIIAILRITPTSIANCR